MYKAYVAMSWNMPKGILCAVKDKLTELGIKAESNYKDEIYSRDKLELADCVVFILNEISFNQKCSSFTNGILKEFIYCVNHNKPMFIAYKAQAGLGIYAAKLDDESLVLTGIASSRNSIQQWAEFATHVEAVVPTDKIESTEEFY
nr:MAG: Nucleoside 2-deoxyribosyltransferase like protein [Bacteriophage sp.]